MCWLGYWLGFPPPKTTKQPPSEEHRQCLETYLVVAAGGGGGSWREFEGGTEGGNSCVFPISRAGAEDEKLGVVSSRPRARPPFLPWEGVPRVHPALLAELLPSRPWVGPRRLKSGLRAGLPGN